MFLKIGTMNRVAILWVIALVLICSCNSSVADGHGKHKNKKGDVVSHDKKKIGRGNGTVTYDSRSLIVNGKRELFFSGSIHYPRSTPNVILDHHLLFYPSVILL